MALIILLIIILTKQMTRLLIWLLPTINPEDWGGEYEDLKNYKQ